MEKLFTKAFQTKKSPIMLNARPVRVFRTVKDIQEYRKNLAGKVGFVPTMGALHEGHAHLLKRSKLENDHTFLSIFVNPTQFNNSQDLETYPKTWDSDLKIAESLQIDGIFFPTYEEIYPDHFHFSANEEKLSSLLCGATRPGHFKGVLTVVMKLFNIISPHKAYFGEKDYQQFQLIKKMTEAFFMPTEVVGVPTVRDADGLAKSSRNLRLSVEDRKIAPLLFKIITETQDLGVAAERLKASGFKIDYLEDIEGRRYVAAFLGEVRLIDNVTL